MTTQVTGTGINFNGSTSGTIVLTQPAIAGSNTLTLPAETSTLATQAYVTTSSVPTAGAIIGCEGSTTGSSATLTVSAGRATDSTYAASMIRSASLAKTTSAWSAGAGGGLDTGAIANSTWYHWYLIYKTDGTTDFTFSTNATTPTLPSGYTLYRRIFSWKTNGSAQWNTVLQIGNYFYTASSLDVNGASGSTLVTLSVPTGIIVQPNIWVYGATPGSSGGATITVAPAALQAATRVILYMDGSSSTYAQVSAEGPATNTSAQIYYTGTGGSLAIQLYTSGWIDFRGRDR